MEGDGPRFTTKRLRELYEVLKQDKVAKVRWRTGNIYAYPWQPGEFVVGWAKGKAKSSYVLLTLQPKEQVQDVR